MDSSTLRGLHKLPRHERRRLVGEATRADADELARALERGGLDEADADALIENVLGTYALPYAVALYMQVNGRDHVVPMVVEEPSVVAAVSNAAKRVRAGGGFVAEVDDPRMIAQIQLCALEDPGAATRALLAAEPLVLRVANAAIPKLVARGGGARAIEVRPLGPTSVVVHVIVDCRDAMGANVVNTVAERVAGVLAEVAGGRAGLRILSNLCDRRCVRVACRVPASALTTESSHGDDVADAIEQASRFAEIDPYRAATHNKGIMNGVDAVVMATGNDWRAVEAGAHAYAARSGSYQPLATWRRVGSELVGRLELPLALGTVGGALRVHRLARMSLRLLGVSTARELSAIAASVGMASNLAALRALATEGIQRGHMALHRRAEAPSTVELPQRLAV